MGLSQLDDNKPNGNGNNGNRNNNNGRNNNDRNYDRGGNDGRRQDERDRDNLDQDYSTLRTAAANPFGGSSNPSRALGALLTYAQEYIERKTRGKPDLQMQSYIVENNVAVPSIVITMSKLVDNKTYVIGHAIMLVDNNNPPQAITERNYNGIAYRDNTVWADALDQDYIDEIVAVIERETATKVDDYISAGGTAVDYSFIPTERLISEKGLQIAQLDNLILSVMSGVDGVRAIEQEDTTRDIRPESANPNAQVVGEVSLTPSTSIQPNGDPLAEDFLIKVSEVPNDRNYDRNQDQVRSLNTRNTQDNKVYGAVSGRIDFTYVQPEPVNSYRPAPEDSACFIPEFIIAGFDVLDMAPSLTLILQLISSVGILDTRNPPVFLDAFEPSSLANNASRNLGGLHAEVQNPENGERQERLNFPPSYDANLFHKFVRATIQNRSSISMEVPTQGPLVGILSIFDKAVDYAQRKHNSKYYNDLIVAACNVLTGNAFDNHWKDTSLPVMQPNRAIIPTGYWIDGNQTKRDSREFGYLYYANLDNPAEALEMAMTYDKSFQNENQLIAAQERKQLIVDVQGKNFVQTDNVSRIWFEPDFFQALLMALGESRMDVAIGNTRYAGRGQERRRFDDARYFNREKLDRGYQRYSGRGGRDNRDQGYSNGRNYGATRGFGSRY